MKEEYFWFVFHRQSLLLIKEKEEYSVPLSDTPPTKVPIGSTVHEIGKIGVHTAKTYFIHSPIVEYEGFFTEMVDLRASYEKLTKEEYLMAGKASQILNWDRNSKYCPHCGVPTVQISPIGKQCLQCRQEWYPHLAPATIVLVQKEDSILLVRSRNFKRNYMGLVAGFLEPGESLEECVQREVMEETGIHIKDIRYFGSQSWPYPSGVMIGYTAVYDGGELKLQREELETGGFYTRDNLPDIPQKLSIARQLIDAWLEKKLP